MKKYLSHQRIFSLWSISILLLFVGGSLYAQSLVNINIASIAELDSLPGISENVARAIVEYRSANGPFSSPAQIQKVKGVGKKIYEKIQDLITVEASAPAAVVTEQAASGPEAAEFNRKLAAHEQKIRAQVMDEIRGKKLKADEILAQFNHEPTIFEVQKAAIAHAKIYAKDINRWRRNIHIQAIIPETKFRVDYYTRENSTEKMNQNIDFRDEPDRYIMGPDEYTYYNYDYDYVKYQLQFGWDLDEVIFHRDELRVRSESEDLVDFRTKVVEDITKLYFDRRRLQVNLILTPEVDMRVKLEKELRIQELTALIDTLTGGYFLKKIEEHKSTAR
ncbi:ComEA family DNA-binding protein [candidate division CSSED10-310 bacterium]|uniref:ComEA family DNA-binding protein n=1 Tax=candidate division CSSED10-310 bacterium TaxID=2855610 RepID=A0ABV6YX32_UNCC1